MLEERKARGKKKMHLFGRFNGDTRCQQLMEELFFPPNFFSSEAFHP
jgi:hypothetical protein